MKIVSIHQPHYHPWLGLLHKIASSDLHIVLDDVQFRRRNFHNRALYSSGKHLSLPVINKGLQSQSLKINEIKIASNKDLNKNFRTLQHCYGKTPGWEMIVSDLEAIYAPKNDSLFDVNFQLLKLIIKHYEIETPIKTASEFNIQTTSNQRLIDLCIASDTTTYLSGNGARKYMDDALFNQHNLLVKYQEFEHPIYKQVKSKHFTPGCLALEWLCIDPESAKIWSKRTQAKTQKNKNRKACCV